MRIYELILSDESLQGVDCISVVESPAMEAKFIALKKQETKVCFKEVDKKKLTLMGIIMKPNKEILRVDQDTNEEYKVFFSEETIKRVSQLYLKNSKQKNFNLEHNSADSLQGYLTESWIVEDVEKDKSNLYNLGAEVGDWVGTLKFDSEEEYNKALSSGTGFSIEGLFEETIKLKKENTMDLKQLKDELINEFKAMFKKEVKLSEVKTEDGSTTLHFEGDMPMVGGVLHIVTADGDIPAPIGEYFLADGNVITVSEVGVIAEVGTKQEEQAPEEQMATPPSVPDVSDLKQAISSMLIKFNEDIETRFSAIETKLSAQVKENEALKVELSETPAVTKIKTAPVAVETQKPQTLRGRLALSLTELKNKN